MRAMRDAREWDAERQGATAHHVAAVRPHAPSTKACNHPGLAAQCRRMGINAISVLRVVALALASFFLCILPAAWTAAALWFQGPGGMLLKNLSIATWCLFSLTLLVLAWQGRPLLALLLFALSFAGVLLWWQTIPASNDRQWADDVARMTHGEVDGDRVTLHNVRNFEWHTTTDYEQRWETRTYDLSRLRTVDMVLSYWAGPSIAHMLMSFGFEGGEYVAYTVEIRRERTEAFSELGGFFKEFELSIIASDERDVLRVRTNVRGEDAYLYHVAMPPEAIRKLFLAYLDEANRIVQKPRWYNTITVNCTTLVYHMMRRIVGYLPFDYRVLFTGYVAGYVYELGGLDQRYTLDDLKRLGHLTEAAHRADRSPTFSTDIRAGIPPLP
jgi:hypothetical protein